MPPQLVMVLCDWVGTHPVTEDELMFRTRWGLRPGVPLGDVARPMGHGVETLVSTYYGALAGDEELANERIETALG